MNTFPFQGFQISGTCGQGHFGIAFGPIESIFDIVGIGWLGKVVAGPQLHRFHRRGNAGIAGEYHDQHLLIVLMQGLHAGQPGRVALQFQVHHGIAGVVIRQQTLCAFQAVRMEHPVTAPLKRPAQGSGKRLVVFDNQQQTFFHCVRHVSLLFQCHDR